VSELDAIERLGDLPMWAWLAQAAILVTLITLSFTLD